MEWCDFACLARNVCREVIHWKSTPDTRRLSDSLPDLRPRMRSVSYCVIGSIMLHLCSWAKWFNWRCSDVG